MSNSGGSQRVYPVLERDRDGNVTSEAFRERVEQMREESWVPADTDTLGIEMVDEDISEVEDEFTADEVESLINETLDGLVVPDRLRQRIAAGKESEPAETITGTYDCICCGVSINGLLGHFEWGIRHGHGRCSSCGYPHRAFHYVYVDDDHEEHIGRLSIILPWHPSQLRFEDEEEDDG